MWKRGLFILLTAVFVVANSSIPGNVQAENGEQLLQGEQDGEVTVRDRVSVHDPSIVVDGEWYYIFGSHMAVAKSDDLSNWVEVHRETAGSTLWGDLNGAPVSFNGAFEQNAFTGNVTAALTGGGTAEKPMGTYDAEAWIQLPDHDDYFDHEVRGNMWAPDVIYNEALGKWCMYLSLNGPRWNSTIVLLTSENIEGPYIYQAPVIFTGFTVTTADLSVRKSFKDTDLELVLGEMDELPEKYRQVTEDGGNEHEWGYNWPHAIDPNVFYDDGKLWMVYGSWSAGICMIELDPKTGLRDYTVTYESDYDTEVKNWTSDAYFGKRIAGGHYVSGEGPYIEKIGDFYYLFVTYGALNANGGYVMRIFRSENPDGPYWGPGGETPLFTDGYVRNHSAYHGDGERGEKIMGYYKWNTMSKGEGAQGHNSVLTDDDGKIYVIYHTRFTDGTGFHEVRVHQLFVNEDGWLVAAPYEYGGETLSENPYTESQAAGEYEIIMHEYDQDFENLVHAAPEKLILGANGSISGAYTGTWSLSSSKPEIFLAMGEKTYKGVLIEQKVDGEAYEALCFTASNEDGLNIWGSKISDAKVSSSNWTLWLGGILLVGVAALIVYLVIKRKGKE